MKAIDEKTLSPNIRKKFSRAKTQLLLRSPFFGSMLLQCNQYWVGDEVTETAGTDGRDLYFNPEFIDSLNEAELQGLIVHEILHKVFLHSLRRVRHPEYNEDNDRWNIACDFAIDPIVVEAGFTLPDGEHIDPKYAGKMAEEIFPLLPVKPKCKRPDVLMPSDKPATQAEADAFEREIAIQVQSAAVVQKNHGKLPGALEALIETLSKPKVDWKAALAEFIQTNLAGSDDITFRRPNRRMLAHDLYLPINEGVTVPPLSVMFDTSGSIYSYPEVTQQFASEIAGIISHLQPECTHVLYNDTQIQSHDEILPGDEFELKLKGGGGTDFKQAFDFIVDMETPPVINIVFTDLYFDFDNLDQSIPTLWVTYGDDNADTTPPFGRRLHIEG